MKKTVLLFLFLSVSCFTSAQGKRWNVYADTIYLPDTVAITLTFRYVNDTMLHGLIKVVSLASNKNCDTILPFVASSYPSFYASTPPYDTAGIKNRFSEETGNYYLTLMRLPDTPLLIYIHWGIECGFEMIAGEGYWKCGCEAGDRFFSYKPQHLEFKHQQFLMYNPAIRRLIRSNKKWQKKYEAERKAYYKRNPAR